MGDFLSNNSTQRELYTENFFIILSCILRALPTTTTNFRKSKITDEIVVSNYNLAELSIQNNKNNLEEGISYMASLISKFSVLQNKFQEFF